ncbi:uncharacterized protein BT62DRAFT_937315 [Guyanagaster necrorhizus]|uniref:Uncharacterized protein n=1 Tax=Guyanagaster necrorhizus TaxID=856835 RepID=A0A9P7VIS7_9AGAR|nr:uncharacterized protein BT62DRAFT_937315 [Guyanagaster necrorhizus MCA 3950]KAG7441282.1 hypothetical protein BT62DRAFT_937315 [Guyanagaster necrorhizus MCA 3950]
MVPIVKSEVEEEAPEDNIIHFHSPAPPMGLGWDHPSELYYLDASSWSKDEIVRHLITNSFSVPGHTYRSKWATITSRDGATTVVPNLYRIPLMFVAQFMWSSLQLVLGDEEWDRFKTGILYMSRLCEDFLGTARGAMSGEGIGRSWRCATFDRALIRYRLGWLLSERMCLKEFWEMYGEDAYRKDAVKFDWKRLVLKGIKGFRLDEKLVEGGITATQWMSGLKGLGGDWVWDTSAESICTKDALDYLESWKGSLPPPSNCQTTPLVQMAENASTTADLNQAFPLSPPSPELFQLLDVKSQSQERRIALLEREVALLKGLQAPIVVPESTPVLVPTPSFVDQDLSRNPLDKFSVKEECGIGMQIAPFSAPVKSLRKLWRMEA